MKIQSLVVVFIITVITFYSYWPALKAEFVDYDDIQYVSENTYLQNAA